MHGASRLRTALALSVALAAAACGSGAQPPTGGSNPIRATTVGQPSTASTPGSSGALVALPTYHECKQPATATDMILGTKVIVEATISPGRAVSDGEGGIRLPLVDAAVLWSSVKDTPTDIAESVPVSDADKLLNPGRYVLFLGSSTAGVYYLAQGINGAFAFADSSGSLLTRVCHELSPDGSTHPPTTAPGAISRASLLKWGIEAATTHPVVDPGLVNSSASPSPTS